MGTVGRTSSWKGITSSIVDVGKVRTLIWCRRCAGWASENRSGKRVVEQEYRLGRRMEHDQTEGVYVQGRWVPITAREVHSFCNFHDEGTFMAQCGLWDKMDKKLVDTQNDGPDLFDEISEATMLHKGDKRLSL